LPRRLGRGGAGEQEVDVYAWPDPERYIVFFEIPGDDYGGMEDLMISPDHFRSMFKPALRRIVECVKSCRADLPVVFHTDGAIKRIIPDLVEIGIDVLNPFEPLHRNLRRRRWIHPDIMQPHAGGHSAGEHPPHVRERAEARGVRDTRAVE
jgi:hypothetical protein